MSYRPTSAGHEDAPLQRVVHVHEDPEIAALYAYLCTPAPSGSFSSIDDVVIDVQNFFKTRVSWPQERVVTAFHSDQFPHTMPRYARFVEKKSSVPSFSPYPSDQLLFASLAMSRDAVLFYQPIALRPAAYCNMGDQSKRVLVYQESNDKKLSSVPWRIGEGTRGALVLHTGSTSPYDSHNAVILHLGESSPATGGGRNHTLELKSTPWRFGLTEHPEGLSGEVLDKKLIRYLDELEDIARNDPHSLHARYGPTPGPTIFSYFIERILKTNRWNFLNPNFKHNRYIREWYLKEKKELPQWHGVISS